MNLVKNGTKHWSPKLWHDDLIHFSELGTIEISIKSGKHGITPVSSSYTIHKVRLGKNLQKSILAFKGAGGLGKPSTLMVPEFHPLFLFS
jgi:hypothetical protein